MLKKTVFLNVFRFTDYVRGHLNCTCFHWLYFPFSFSFSLPLSIHHNSNRIYLNTEDYFGVLHAYYLIRIGKWVNYCKKFELSFSFRYWVIARKTWQQIFVCIWTAKCLTSTLLSDWQAMVVCEHWQCISPWIIVLQVTCCTTLGRALIHSASWSAGL